MSTVLAAGAVLWRQAEDGVVVAVVHRPHYDDWSLPKGKLDDGETPAYTAVREIAEETGFACVLGARLSEVRYPLPGSGATKVVQYFSARATNGQFARNSETDELRWCTPTQARELLSYPRDGRVLDAFHALPTDLRTVLLVRHAKAGARADWAGDDDLRPLSRAGGTQAGALATLLGLWAPSAVHSAPRLRCEHTVSPFAERLGVHIDTEPLLSEEGYWPDPDAGMRRFRQIGESARTVVVCSQGGVIPDLVQRLAGEAKVDLGKIGSKKGSVWVLSFHLGALAAADYYWSPLPPARPA